MPTVEAKTARSKSGAVEISLAPGRAFGSSGPEGWHVWTDADPAKRRWFADRDAARKHANHLYATR